MPIFHRRRNVHMNNNSPAMSASLEDPDPLGSEVPEEPPSPSAALARSVLFPDRPARRFSLPLRIPISNRTRQFINEFYPHITEAEWSNWHWQIRNSICTLDQIRGYSRFLKMSMRPSPAARPGCLSGSRRTREPPRPLGPAPGHPPDGHPGDRRIPRLAR